MTVYQLMKRYDCDDFHGRNPDLYAVKSICLTFTLQYQLIENIKFLSICLSDLYWRVVFSLNWDS